MRPTRKQRWGKMLLVAAVVAAITAVCAWPILAGADAFRGGGPFAIAIGNVTLDSFSDVGFIAFIVLLPLAAALAILAIGINLMPADSRRRARIMACVLIAASVCGGALVAYFGALLTGFFVLVPLLGGL